MGILLNYMFSRNPGKQEAPDHGLTYYILKRYTHFRTKGHLKIIGKKQNLLEFTSEITFKGMFLITNSITLVN